MFQMPKEHIFPIILLLREMESSDTPFWSRGEKHLHYMYPRHLQWFLFTLCSFIWLGKKFAVKQNTSFTSNGPNLMAGAEQIFASVADAVSQCVWNIAGQLSGSTLITSSEVKIVKNIRRRFMLFLSQQTFMCYRRSNKDFKVLRFNISSQTSADVRVSVAF